MTSTLNAMKSAKRWLLHHNKKPFYAASLLPRGATDEPEDLHQLVDHADAVSWLEHHQLKNKAQGFGLGFALGPDGKDGFWQGIDLDHIDENGLTELVPALPGYVEHSPSGKGVHAIGYGDQFAGRTNRGTGIEFYSKGRYFTFTGHLIRDEPLIDLTDFLDTQLRPKTTTASSLHQPKIEVSQIIVDPKVYDDLEEALKVIPADNYETWHEVLQALKRLGDTQRAFRLAMNWSMSSPDPEHTLDVFLRKWEQDLNTPGALTYKTIFKRADDLDPNWRHKVKTEDLWPEVDLSNLELEPVDYLIDGFLARSLMVLVGKPGMGKSTAMMALCAAVAGIHIPNSPLSAPAKGRKVIYVTEDTVQFKRNMIALCKNCGINIKELAEAIVLLPARRVQPHKLAGLKQKVEHHTTFTPDSIMLRPWIVFDTISASIHLDDENSNAEVSNALAFLKAEFFEVMECSVCLIAHSAKHVSRSDFISDARGAGAWAGDTTLTSGIFEEQGVRYLMLGKRRYSPLHTGLQISLLSTTVTVTDRYGRAQDQVLETAQLHWADSSSLQNSITQISRRNEDQDARVLRFIADRSRAGISCSFNGLYHDRSQIGMGKDRLNGSLERLVKAGHIMKGQGTVGTNAGWNYFLTELGINAAAQPPT